MRVGTWLCTGTLGNPIRGRGPNCSEVGGAGAGQRQPQGGHPLSPGAPARGGFLVAGPGSLHFSPGPAVSGGPQGSPQAGGLVPAITHSGLTGLYPPGREGSWFTLGASVSQTWRPHLPLKLCHFLGSRRGWGLAPMVSPRKCVSSWPLEAPSRATFWGGGQDGCQFCVRGTRLLPCAGAPPHPGFLSHPGSGDPPPLLPALFPVLCTGLLAVHTQVTAGHLPGGACQSAALVAPDP